MPRLYLRFVVLVALAIANPARAKELWDLPWTEVRSPHFVIVSALPEKRTVAIAHDLEDFRSAVQLVTHIGRVEERIGTTVYVLPYGVEKLGFKSHISGFFMPQMRANYAAVIPMPAGHLDEALKHEYVHFLVRNRDVLSYPPWLDEGLAEVLQTLTARGDVIEYGVPTHMRVVSLQNPVWIPFAKVLQTRDVFGLKSSEIAMFYAQSWLLVHYLMVGRPERTFDADSRVFLDAMETAKPPAQAFEEAFGVTVVQLDSTLRRYAEGRAPHRRVSLAQALSNVPMQVRPVAPDAIAAQMGVLLMLRGEHDEAKRYFDVAIALNANNGLALAGLGECHKLAGRFDEALPYYEKALALAPEDAHAELDYAEFVLDRARAVKDPAAIQGELKLARRHLARSYELDPENPETLAMNGVSYMFLGEPLFRALESLNAAHAMLPSQPAIKLLLAQAYAESGERESAMELLLSLVAWSDPEIADQASRLLDKLMSTK
jgi:FimV-like protein